MQEFNKNGFKVKVEKTKYSVNFTVIDGNKTFIGSATDVDKMVITEQEIWVLCHGNLYVLTLHVDKDPDMDNDIFFEKWISGKTVKDIKCDNYNVSVHETDGSFSCISLSGNSNSIRSEISEMEFKSLDDAFIIE